MSDLEMTTPTLEIVITPAGLREVKVFYRPDQREAAWKMCKEYVALLLREDREREGCHRHDNAPDGPH
jgi:hypothetical protein